VRRLRLNRLEAAPLPAAQVVLAASLEVRGAVIYATFIVALVFVPVITLSGVAGSLFAPLGIAYIAAIMASLVVALTVTPALALTLLRGTTTRPSRRCSSASSSATPACWHASNGIRARCRSGWRWFVWWR